MFLPFHVVVFSNVSVSSDFIKMSCKHIIRIHALPNVTHGVILDIEMMEKKNIQTPAKVFTKVYTFLSTKTHITEEI